MNQVINYALDLLVEEREGLTFGLQRDFVLHNVAASIVLTFPDFGTELRPGDNELWRHKNLFFFNIEKNKPEGHVLNRFKYLQRVAKRKTNSDDSV